MHIIQRGNNRNNCFFTTSDYLVYLDLLRRSAAGAGCRIHAYVLMTNHIHILASPEQESAPANMMKAIGERYVQYVNQRYNRSGTLWDGRYKSCLVQDETYLMVCHRYIEQNPVRAGMVTHPSLYQWSSHRCNAYGNADQLITPHPIFTSLGSDDFARALAYRALFAERLSDRELAELRDATNYNYTFGNAAFAEKMSQSLGRQVARVSETMRSKKK
ncbi:MAG: transposase [Pseudomonadota bacterium]